MTYLGDFAIESTFDCKFTTVNTTGAPTTLAGTPVVSIYVGNSITQLTAGITLTVDFDTVTGLHNVRVVATAANGYATASNYQLVITTGTVGGTSVVGYVIGQFSIEARSAIRPTVAARTLDVSATGEAGVDWANVGSPTTTVGLSGTTVATVTTTTTATNVTTVNGLAAAVITAASIAVDAITDAKVAADVTIASVTGAVGSVTAGVTVTTNNDKTGYGLSAAAVQAVWDAATTALTVVGSIGKKLADWVIGTSQTGDSFVRLGAPAGASVSADIAAIKAETASIQTDTNDLQVQVGTAGAGLTNINLPNQTMDIVGNITGNLSGSVGSVTNRVTANTDQINGVATAAARLALSTQGIGTGTVGAGSTTTSIVTSALDPAAAVIDQFKGRVIIFKQDTTTANLRGQATDITASTALGVLTVTALTTAPVSGDTFTIT